MMEALAVAILGINGTLIGALIWLLKITFSRLFGSSEQPGIISMVNATLQSMNADIRENTVAIRELQRIFKEQTRETARRSASDPQ